jgi:metal-responsive CopG/Arc/MetJ family transcriptional regulator
MTDEPQRTERFQIMLSTEELSAIDDFRFKNRMPNRASAVRELIRRGLAAAKKDRTA